MSIESLKQQARKHEQNEDWIKALDHYNKALAELEREEQVDIGLYNRVGDLFVRVGNLDGAVEHYDRAVELYREAYLPNNAIAVCKKIIRNVPDRHQVYLVMGQIRAEQGFIPDARTNFLTYAERMQQAGDLDESFRALVEFCDLAPDDIGVRLSVADQMIASERKEDGLRQLALVHRHYLELGNTAEATDIESRILAIDAAADIAALASSASAGGDVGDGLDGAFGELSFGEVDLSAGSEEELSFAVEGAAEEAASDDADTTVGDFSLGGTEGEEDDAEIDAGFGDFEIASEAEDADTSASTAADDDVFVAGDENPFGEEEAEADPLPMMDVDLGEADGAELDDAEDAAEPLPMMDVDLDDEEDIGPAELPTMDFGDEGDVAAVGLDEMSEASSDLAAAAEALEAAVEEQTAFPEEPEVAPNAPSGEPKVEVGGDDAFVVEAPADQEQPESSSEPEGGYVDFGAMILGTTPDEKSTRLTVAYEEPSGDEEADFAKMLNQFKEKISENLDSSDVRAHYDLGTAYKEMGLLEEAISSFQAALRASGDHLPTYELMGQTFMEMGQPEAAVKSLQRALSTEHSVEDELVGIYYYLARAYEELENRESAVEYYDRVFALDINFADVTERLRTLR